jgi:diadenylate cyclase
MPEIAAYLFITFRWLDALDILLVSFLLYQVYHIVRGTVAINIFAGILSFYLLWLFVKALNMQLLGSILGQFIGVGVIALIVVFQQEIRRFLLLVGTKGILGNKNLTREIFSFTRPVKPQRKIDIPSVVKACKNMSETNTGAIIIIAKDTDIRFYTSTGEPINAKVSPRLIESIFFKNSPLHDGAIVITNNMITAARCVLPVTENEDFPSALGMRHRAAVGITEHSDAFAIVVSEQTGEIAYALEGELTSNVSPEQLRIALEKEFN